MKKRVKLYILATPLLLMMGGCSIMRSDDPNAPINIVSQSATNSTLPKSPLKIGVLIYRFDDTFMTEVRNSILAAADSHVIVEFADSRNSQSTQNHQMDKFVKEKVDALAINPVDRTAAAAMITKAKAANIPVVFFNREPVADAMKKWDKVYYVGAKAEQSGTMSGQLIADYFKSHPEADKNKDDVLQYVMLKGEPGHQDAELRTKFAIKAVEDAGIKVEKLAEDTGMWERSKGRAKMSTFLGLYGNRIEAVFANNDDMALGAIDAIQENDFLAADRFIPVVGVNGTASAMKAMEDGALLGTVLNDAVNQGKATYAVAHSLATGQIPDQTNIGYEMADGLYVWIPYKKITKGNTSINLSNNNR
ncbi:substrate-binding domain-containing protein [Paenibacillus sp. LMG 31461]|uniref:D-galactose/methyl-galactoside binding periplasmic protein MglB n=1 Tax=Paenibacillus plantarum TaxID=2654975 RepID=A0ABX1X741_9BACL|nr:galactose ABC transporter substrate-binding protein [Paenibacillus plantarum]NOU63893.1 substrate-binding domain-containing protein [Paenibacillus plantarum]